MDTMAIGADGRKPLEPELARIAEIKNVADRQAEAERLHSRGVGALLRFNSTQDAKDSTQVIGAAFQGGLGLPEREYYLKADDKSKQLREDYTKHVTKMFELLGDSADQAPAEAATILKIETTLATASMKNTDLRDPDKTYHKMALADLRTLSPNFSWEAYFKAAGHPELKEINVGQPDFFKALDAQLTATPIAGWKTYLRWHLVNAAASGLTEKLVAEDFDFRGKTLTGAKEIQPRWKRCVQSTDRVLGEALGQVYVQKYFPPEAKARAQEMVRNLIAALRDDLQTLPWMGPQTRAQATAKLQAFAVKIGYTDKWRDYSALQIGRSSYAENQGRGAEFDFARRLNKIGKPVDRTEWGMTPPTVNAYNNSSMKEIVFPPGILQPPISDPQALAARAQARIKGLSPGGGSPTPPRTSCPGSAERARFRIWRGLPRLWVERRASRWCANKPAKSGSQAQPPESNQACRKIRRGPFHPAAPVLEEENDSTRKLEVVLRLFEEAGEHVVAFQANGDGRVPAVVRSTASFDGIRVAAESCDLRLFVGAPKNSVQPLLPLVPPPDKL